MRRIAPAILLALLLAASPVYASKALVKWVNPTQNVDGTALTDLASIDIEWGSCNADGSFGTQQAGVTVPATMNSWVITPTHLSPVCVRAVAVTSSGLTSAWSNVAEWTPPATPGQPGTISGVIRVNFQRIHS